MPTLKSVMAELERKGSEKTRATYARHGVVPELALGVSVADLKTVAKTIRKQQALACELYDTGIFEAMYLAGIVADGAQLSRKQLQEWADATAGLQMISEYTVPWVALDHSGAREMALKWMGSAKEHVAASGWCTYSGLVATRADNALDRNEIERLLGTVVEEIRGARNRVRYTMNGFVIAVGSYMLPLSEDAKHAAQSIGKVIVDMGDTACAVPVATDHIQKVEAAGKMGRKKKTIRC
jgi:DNA alkylation repair enzyme